MPYYDVDDAELYVRERGSGPAAVFIHQLMGDHTLWLDQLAGLSDIRRCVAYDQRGYGRSSAVAVPPSGILDLDRYVADVPALLDTLGEDRADLVGFSVGGLIALMAAIRHPDRVRSVSMLSTGLKRPDEAARAAGQRYLEGNALRATMESKVVLYRQFNDYLFGPNGGNANLVTRARYRSMFEGTRTDMQMSAFRTLANAPDITDQLPSVAAPVQIVLGELDVVPEDASREMAALMQDGDVVILPNVGRMGPIENADDFSNCLRKFWSGREA